MKPVIKKHTHYSLLLMRDDTEARTLRIHTRTIRVLFTSFLLLVIAGAAGTAGGVHYWRKYRVLSEKYDTQSRLISEMDLRLQRLVGYEALLEASNGTLPQVKYEEVGVVVPSGRLVAGSPIGTTTTDTPEQSGSTPVAEATPAQEVDQTPVTDAVPSETVSGAEQTAPVEPQSENLLPLLSSEESPLRISEFTGRITGPQRLRINYELSTAPNDEQRMISGLARYYGIMTDGTRIDLITRDSDGTRFSITRMKLMQTTGRLPDEHKAADVETIEVVIEVSEGAKYRESFPVNK